MQYVMAGQVGGKIASKAELEALIAAMANGLDAGGLAVTALAEVLSGVITGEGPTTQGRIHYSRCIDAHDAALVARILKAGGGQPIARAEADLLFDIHDAGRDRKDDGAFAELLGRAIAHHVLAAAGRPVPPRAVALERPLSAWVPEAHTLTGEAAAWLAARLRRPRGAGALAAVAASLGVATPRNASVAAMIDLAA